MSASDLFKRAIKDVEDLEVGADTSKEVEFALVKAWFKGYEAKEAESVTVTPAPAESLRCPCGFEAKNRVGLARHKAACTKSIESFGEPDEKLKISPPMKLEFSNGALEAALSRTYYAERIALYSWIVENVKRKPCELLYSKTTGFFYIELPDQVVLVCVRRPDGLFVTTVLGREEHASYATTTTESVGEWRAEKVFIPGGEA